MPDRDSVINNLIVAKLILCNPQMLTPEMCIRIGQAITSAISLLKEQEGYVSVPFSWLVKFCTHIDFKEPLTDAEREAAWRKKLWQQFDINAPEKAVE